MKPSTSLSLGVVVMAAMLAVTCAVPWKRKLEDGNEKNINMCLVACAMCFDSDSTVSIPHCVNHFLGWDQVWAMHCLVVLRTWSL